MGVRAAMVLAAVLGAYLAGCNEAEESVPPSKVEGVTAYGVTLDQKASPQDVAYVLLRSLAEDVQAAQAHPPRREDQKKANMITWSLAAPDEIERRLVEGRKMLTQGAAPANSLGPDRDKQIYAVVNLWAPIVAYYVDSFDKDRDKATQRMTVRTAQGVTGLEVLYDVWPDPSRPDKDRHQTLSINVVMEKGYYRVARVSFVTPPAKPKVVPLRVPATQPATRNS